SPWPFQRDGRTTEWRKARDARPGVACAGGHASSAFGSFCGCQPPRRSSMIERLEQVVGGPVSRETFEKLKTYSALLKEESSRQNLVSASTLDQLWDRHILDSAQLVRFEPHLGSSWADVGSGAGLPGIVIAILVEGPVLLIEPRRLRAEFLHKLCASLELNATVHAGKAERAEG